MAVLRSIRQVALASALAGLALVGCSSSDPDGAVTTTSSTASTTSSTTSTTAAPATARVVVAGDSMMYDVAPGVEAALDPATTEVMALVVPSLFSPAVHTSLDEAVRAAPTDAVVVLAGVWETGYETSDGLDILQPGWGERYRDEVLVPFADRMAALDAHLVLLAHPPMRAGDADGRFAAVYAQWGRLAGERPDTVTFSPTGPWLGVGDGYVERTELPDGTTARLRRTDGVHFCAEGATRMASGLIDLLATVVGPPWEPILVEDWEDGAWTERFPADECPPEVGG